MLTDLLAKYNINIVLIVITLLLVTSCTAINKTTLDISKNPMIDYKYDPEEGDYYNLVEDYLVDNNINPKEHHFKTFPVKYFVGEMDEEWEALVREAISDFKEYFPMEEVEFKSKADLVVKIVDADVIKEKYPDLPEQNLSGVGGIKTISPKLEAIVLLLPHAFENKRISKAIVLHELGHAFGIAAHSDDPYDIMYPHAITKYNEETGLITINDIELSVEEANYLSVRDLNTLWKLYSHW